MNILVTGGAGFIGRWVVKRLLEDGHKVWVLDDLSNGQRKNIEEFLSNPNFAGFVEGDIKNIPVLETLFENKFDICYHLAASINVQDSIDDPGTTFQNDVVGTFNVLEQCRKHNTKIVFMSTCMVYDRANDENGITEAHPTKPASPYAGSKIAGENMVLSYWYAYKLPAVVIRPFNTYGPMQKSSGEGGVVAIFIRRNLEGLPLNIYGDGCQTRDLLYVEDCAEFVVRAGYSDRVNGEIINAGLGRDISINDLALLIAKDKEKIVHVPHIHPQSEIAKLLCNYQKAKELLGWTPKVSLEEGIKRTEEWIRSTLAT
ncbi:MAG TPA: NAD-dependent dehydratase [Hungateiclostridium thermocellum]|uniref:NAD-dependent epimerase/dehydratase n=2 Tax=Acetivibrio thermocellus TaxID=1515 RepID=A3DHJ3_ACET2|nr:GDP-mannose 4,6-dehydratase [Acetivibrio thermocellus]CDG36734.1 NAD-dependent epimerase/dehydratase [Acetivibrio thermocellus BC1]ABN53422.1 NAD-dependent epimerase/dehydratase [Acetivibrio thermocellus ATCC 27405]ADU75873.1 NAD-dependent epimerase/dehydratase [Acetivibrio thermocellus DSM 1313]ALX09905.1 dTDP-glucose 4,6-dehydratase [Acetivibrio thermocellus AD2]ANV77679.1 dTDP-glucose 4,6-dehydratase [Acetivibrio thermocellus DSM 2360]